MVRRLLQPLLYELGVDVYVINGSDEGRFLDTVRNNEEFRPSTVSLSSDAKHKVIIIDEADNTTPDVQLCLRAFTEEFVKNCRFIFTCNYKNKIIQPSTPGVSSLNFRSSPKTAPQLAANFFQRIKDILDQESVKYDPKVIVELINKYFPDWRRVLNELQRYSVGGKIDAGILQELSEVKTNDLVKHLKEKNFPEVRKWVVNNLDNDPSVLIHGVYDACYANFENASIPACTVLLLPKYQYQMLSSPTKK